MPYISEERRQKVLEDGPQDAGDLNYCFTAVIAQYVLLRSEKQGGLSYQLLNDVLGALEGAKLEFQRRIVEPYENAKLALNGDVYAE